MKKFLKITEETLDVAAITDLVADAAAGAINVFVGTVRSNTRGRAVVRLEFEAYESMALKEMDKICRQAGERWPVLAMAVYHRTGVLQVGDVPVVIAVSTPHREQGFAACQYAIDTLKQTVPIWKKEIFADGEEWVSAHP